MIRHILWRVVNIVPLLFVLSVLVFFIAQARPGDPIKDAYDQKLSPEAIELIRQAYGLDQPLYKQYGHWLGSLFTSGGGVSINLNSPVAGILGPAFGNTLILGAAATVIAVVLGVVIGFASGLRHGRLFDRGTMLFVQIGSNLPIYWLGLIVVWLFAVQLGVIPAAGMHDVRSEGGFGDLLWHLIAPACTASLVSLLIIARFVRSAVVDSNNSDYVRTYRSQGFGRRAVIGKHIGRNVLPPIVNVAGLTAGSLISNVVFVEMIFSWPGVGSVLLNAIAGNDYPLIQAGILAVAVTFVVLNLLTDVALDLLNPRLRHA